MEKTYITHSAEETIAFGQKLAKNLPPNSIICLFGDLGAGKTTLAKGIISALTNLPPHDICSPTFAYLNVYQGPSCPVYHFDLYRLNSPLDFLNQGFEDYFYANGICCLEWSERITPLLPQNIHKITLSHNSNATRTLVYEV